MSGPMTLNDWAVECNEAMDLNGFNDTEGRLLTESDPVAQIAGLSPVKIAFTDVVEAIRRPWRNKSAKYSPRLAALRLLWKSFLLALLGPKVHTWLYLHKTGEGGEPISGSRQQVVHREVLTDTETSEAIDGILADDLNNWAEETADTLYRQLSKIGHWNATHPDRAIDIDAWMHYKHGVNIQRGYRHGGKRA